MYVIQRLDNLISWSQVATSTSAVTVASLLPAGAFTQSSTSCTLTNNDTTNSIYLGWGGTLTSSKYWKVLKPGQDLDMPLGIKCLNNLYCIASAGTPNLSVALLGG